MDRVENKASKEKAMGMLKAIEAHLLKTLMLTSNPQTAKHKVEVLDKENFTYCYSIIEGEMLGTTFEKITHEVKINALPLGGSMLKCTDSYFTAEEINTWKEKVSAMYEAIEAISWQTQKETGKGDRKSLSHSVWS
ncbi:major allergen Pru av 1-like [Eucalyptus grandis]|uniref:major allergen Pru av 1-like n=1 Tax=Eucalyptus grandis TaxID=71139 RepID=UPI00192E76ED|nr:major allergen Pru av 1-like [Eucalyptus grandis]